MKCILIQLKKNYPAYYLLYSVCMKYCMHGIPNCVKYPCNAADLLCDCHPWESHTGAEPTALPSSPCWWSSGSSSYAVLGRVCFTDNGQCCRGLESVLLRRLGVLGAALPAFTWYFPGDYSPCTGASLRSSITLTEPRAWGRSKWGLDGGIRLTALDFFKCRYNLTIQSLLIQNFSFGDWEETYKIPLLNKITIFTIFKK